MTTTPDTALLVMWLTFTAAAVLGVSGVLVWAVRSRQFSNQERARHLPLMSGIPAEAPTATQGASRPCLKGSGDSSPRPPTLDPRHASPGGPHVPA